MKKLDEIMRLGKRKDRAQKTLANETQNNGDPLAIKGHEQQIAELDDRRQSLIGDLTLDEAMEVVCRKLQDDSQES